MIIAVDNVEYSPYGEIIHTTYSGRLISENYSLNIEITTITKSIANSRKLLKDFAEVVRKYNIEDNIFKAVEDILKIYIEDERGVVMIKVIEQKLSIIFGGDVE